MYILLIAFCAIAGAAALCAAGIEYLSSVLPADDTDVDEYRQYAALHPLPIPKPAPQPEDAYTKRNRLLAEHNAELADPAYKQKRSKAAWYQENKEAHKARAAARRERIKKHASKTAAWTPEKREAHSQLIKKIMNAPAMKQLVSERMKQSHAARKAEALGSLAVANIPTAPVYGARALA